MTKKSLRTLYRHAKQGDLTAQVELDNSKKVYLDRHIQRYERLSIILTYRNLTVPEAHLFYTSGIKVSALSPTYDTRHPISSMVGVGVGSYKKRIVASYTHKHLICPCCKIIMLPRQCAWYVQDGFIEKGFLKICLTCKERYYTSKSTRTSKIFMPREKCVASGQCISVYYDAFMSLCAGGNRELGLQVYKVYLDRGLVFDRTSKSKQGIANFAMRQAINEPDDRVARDKDIAEYEQENL